MTKGILGRKIGMTQIFTEDGNVVPVTVIEAGPCVVLQKKDAENDGYNAIQLGFDDKKESRANKPEIGHAKKAGAGPKKFIKEIRGVNIEEYEVGQEIRVDIFSEGEYVDVTGTSKGKGFAGSIKRHGQKRGASAHGSKYHRGPGSMGSIAPNRVFPSKNLPGHMGHETVTKQNLQVIKVFPDQNVMLVKGSVPGPRNGYLKIRSAVKKKG